MEALANGARGQAAAYRVTMEVSHVIGHVPIHPLLTEGRIVEEDTTMYVPASWPTVQVTF